MHFDTTTPSLAVGTSPEINSTRIEPEIPITEPAVDGSVDLLEVQAEVPGV